MRNVSNMEISNELLAAYAEGNVTPEERETVRNYLVEHPSQLESMMMMMDNDYDLDLDTEDEIYDEGIPDHYSSYAMMDACCDYESFSSSNFSKCCCIDDNYCEIEPSKTTSFAERLDDLLDEII